MIKNIMLANLETLPILTFLVTDFILYVCVLSHQSSLTLCNPMGYSLPGSSLHGIFRARILKYVALSSSRESSQPRD